MTDVHGVDRAALTRWLGQRVQLDEPVTFTAITGGRSNLTYRVEDASGRAWVLRRPPLHSVLASAHDVGREHRILAALASSDVPVPAVVGYEPSLAVTGAPFYVMDFVDGVVVRDGRAAAELAAARTAAAHDVVDVLARLHALDVAAVGLSDLGRPDGYVARQLRRWHGQYHAGPGRDLALIDEVHRRLAAAIPEQGPAALVHGDYRLDNVIVSRDGAVQAVLDWELATLGDPLADVGLLLVYWQEPGDDVAALPGAPTAAGGFPSRADLVRRYATASGRDLSQLDYYVAFGRWKVACILAGVDARVRAGAYGDVGAGDDLAATVTSLAEAALAAMEAAGR